MSNNIASNDTFGDTTITEGALINSATSKTTPIDADEIGLVDSAASNVLKKLTWSNLKAALKTYFDTLYQPSSQTWTSWTPTLANITLGNGTLSCTYILLSSKTLHYRFQLIAGSTTAISTTSLATFTLPEALSSNIQQYTQIGDLTFIDASANLPIKGYGSYQGNFGSPSKGVVGLYIFFANGTYTAGGIIQSGIPATVGTGDIITVTGTCEIA